METLTLPNPHETHSPNGDNYDFLDTYEGYDNPDLIADLRISVINASRNKDKNEARKIRNTLIARYLDARLDMASLDDDEANEYYNDARDDVRYWLSISPDAWSGDVDEDGNYVGNGVYDDIAEEVRDFLTTPDDDTDPADLLIVTQEAAQAHAESLATLTRTREQLAKLQTGLRFKFGRNKKDYKEALAAAKTAYEAAVITNTKAGFALIREQKPDLTSDEAKYLAQMAYANEFSAMLAEQKNPAHIDTKYGKTVRKLGSMSLPAKAGIFVATVAGGALAASIGGVTAIASAVGFFGYRLGKTLVGGTLGHNTQSGTERIQKKVTKKSNESAHRDIESSFRTTSDERFAQTVGSHILNSANRIDRSDRNRRITSAAVTIGVLVPGLIGTIHKIQGATEAKHLVKGVVKDRIIGKTPVVEKPVDSVPSIITPQDVIPTTPPVSVLHTAAELTSLDHLIHAHGVDPWSRAVNFYNGDKAGATAWVKMAAKKAGATIHNAGTRNEWYEINGRSDTDYVWSKLTEAMLTPSN